MKVKITENTPQMSEYPKMMASTNRPQLIVLFSAESIGVVVSGTDSLYDVGYFCETWAMELFSPYKGVVTLEND